jgi:hypothetical protein
MHSARTPHQNPLGSFKDYRLRHRDRVPKYEFASSNTSRTTFAFDACFVWKLALLVDERNGFFIENLSRQLM